MPSDHHSLLRSTLLRPLSPIEVFTLVGLFVSFVVLDLFGRPFFFLFGTYALIIAAQLNWLLPCFCVAYVFRLFNAPTLWARRFYVGYFGLTAAIFFGGVFGSAFGEGMFQQTLARYVTGFALFNLGLLLLCGALTWRRWRSNAAAARETLTVGVGNSLLTARLIASLMLCFSFYSNLKPMIPVIHPGLIDDTLYRMDCLLLLGNDPFRLLNRCDAAWFVSLMQQSYLFFFFFILFGLAGTLLCGSLRQFEKTLAAFIIAYAIGLAGYLLFPAVGPAFYGETASIFAPTREFGVKVVLLKLYKYFLTDPSAAMIHPFNGLASMPSLHVAHTVLALYYLWQCERRLVYILFVPFVLLVVSTVYLGLHYIVDLPAGVAVAAASVWCVRKFYLEAETETAPTPAIRPIIAGQWDPKEEMQPIQGCD